MTTVVQLFPEPESRLPDCVCRTVGDLLRSIAYLIERGETHTALRQARECAEAYAYVPLPEVDDDDLQNGGDA